MITSKKTMVSQPLHLAQELRSKHITGKDYKKKKKLIIMILPFGVILSCGLLLLFLFGLNGKKNEQHFLSFSNRERTKELYRTAP